ncbi:MAG TPA: VWA domain-containing protein [Catenuloplanes sp.]|jgi:hypothetical protein
MSSNIQGAGVIASAMALVVVLAGSWLAYDQLTKPSCTGQVQLTVAAAPEIADAVQAAATAWTKDGADLRGTCVAVEVGKADAETVAAAIASKHGVALTGIGQARGTTAIPDVWIPDSSTWLMRLRSEASGFVPTDGKPIAMSPVVVAMPEPVAQTIGWPDQKLTWTALLKQITGGADLRTGIVDPARDASGLSGLLALGAAANAAGANAAEATAGTLRTLAAGSSALRDDLLARFPRSGDPTAIATQLSAAPLSEEDVIAYNATKPPVQLAALYVEPAPMALDYPFAVMPEADAARAEAAGRLRAVLDAPTFRESLARSGLRAPDGSISSTALFKAPIGAPGATGIPAPAAPAPAAGGAAGAAGAAAIDQALGSWAAITLPGRMLAVFDVSGSMKTKVPTAGGASRSQVMQEAARQGLGLFDDKWAVGVWVFSTELQGNQDYREVVPISPLTTQRGKLLQSLDSLTPKDDGNTGLFDTTIAAYKRVLDGWEAGRVNSLTIFTDGKNEDDNGLSQAQLIEQLKKAQDPKRPVRLVIIGLGTGVDRPQLESITNAVGGGVFVAEDPAKIRDIFLKAIASRTSIPR